MKRISWQKVGPRALLCRFDWKMDEPGVLRLLGSLGAFRADRLEMSMPDLLVLIRDIRSRGTTASATPRDRAMTPYPEQLYMQTPGRLVKLDTSTYFGRGCALATKNKIRKRG